MLPYFLRSEDNERGASAFHAAGGPLRVSEQRSPRPLNADLIASSEAAGIPRTADYNGPEQDGVCEFQVTQKNGRRWSAADAFLKPAMSRGNLEVLTGVHVLGVDLDGARARGVRIADRRGSERVEFADREVIMSAGAIGSPQLLLASGIGPADHLSEVGVAVRHELPGVGRNLQDHPFVSVLWEVNDTNTLCGADKPQHLAQWLVRRTGKLTSSAAEVVAFVRTRPGLPAADIQFHMGALYYEAHGAEEFDGHAGVIAPALVAPKARGSITLRSSDATVAPRILTNALSEPEDVASLVAGMQLAREIASQQPFAGKIVRELKPGSGASSAADLEADLRRRVELIYHPVGTCRMGTGEDAVVDAELCVRGIDGLRVIDASVMPLIPGGNTNAPTIMIAEKAADIIRGRAPLAARS